MNPSVPIKNLSVTYCLVCLRVSVSVRVQRLLTRSFFYNKMMSSLAVSVYSDKNLIYFQDDSSRVQVVTFSSRGNRYVMSSSSRLEPPSFHPKLGSGRNPCHRLKRLRVFGVDILPLLPRMEQHFSVSLLYRGRGLVRTMYLL